MNFWDTQRLDLARKLGINIDPTQIFYTRRLSSALRSGDRWLDLGCGKQIAPDWALTPELQQSLARRASLALGADLDGGLSENPYFPHRVYASSYEIPFESGSFDLVSANMVMEHLAEPERALREIHRVLKPDGAFLFHTPNCRYFSVWIASLLPDSIKKPIVRVLEQRQPEDVFPTHYCFNSHQSIARIASQSGMAVRELETTPPQTHLARFGPIGVLELFFLRMLSIRAIRPHTGMTFIGILEKSKRQSMSAKAPELLHTSP